jgi:spermidine synthase
VGEWFVEQQTADMRLGLRCVEVLHRSRSPYQEIAVYRTAQFGRLLALDDVIMLTEADEFAYHEMLVHPALLACARPRRVLVVGGGDGGAVREVLRHEAVAEVVLAELDAAVVEACRRHLPWTAPALDDPRVRVRVGDGARFVAEQPPASFDAVIVDAPDPVGHATSLFQPAFYAACRRVLAPGGLLAVQSDSPFVMAATTQHVVRELARCFPRVRVCWAVVPTYAGSLWTFTLGSLGPDPADPPPADRAAALAGCRYWSPQLHRAAFALPAFAERLVAAAATPPAGPPA